MTEFAPNSQTRQDIEEFLRDLVQIPSLPTQEGALAKRIAAEMDHLGFRNVTIDRIGNVIGWVGPGSGSLLMLNGHMDTVQIGNPAAWSYSPFEAQVEDGVLYGLGACDMKAGLAAMIYGAKALGESGVPLKGDVAVACVVQEETCEGLGSQVLIEEETIHPDWVVLAEPTNLDVSRGQRGRLQLRLVTRGRTCHSAQPHKGENAIYAAARLAFGLELLNDQLAVDDFLGPGSLAVTAIKSPADDCSVIPDRCEMIIDRRLTLGENETIALSEIQRVIVREGVEADVEVTEYEATSHTGYACRGRGHYPAWVLREDHPLVQAAIRGIRAELSRRPEITHWPFSTEGVYTAGIAGIPTIGFGPGDPDLAHRADEHVALADVHAATGAYARIAAELLKP